jgi:protein required for attachment to host cells
MEATMVDFVIPSGALVLVADGRRALFMKNVGTAMSVRMEIADVMEAEPNPSNREQGTGPADRAVHQSGVRGTSTVEMPDYHSRAEHEFLIRVMNALDSQVQQGNVRAVVLVAPPKALATLRQVVTPLIKTVLQGEVAKDLVKEPLEKITMHLQS